MTATPRVHDLVRFPAAALMSMREHRPEWFSGVLNRDVWGTIRNTARNDGLVAVGIRGELRHQRWADAVKIEDVSAWKRPEDLRCSQADPARRELPALKSLFLLESKWKELPFAWGPFGSTGVELATGVATITPGSDLDLVLYVFETMDASAARELCTAARDLPAAVDIRIQTQLCGFSLEEYACANRAPILLRFPSGPQMGADPWKDCSSQVEPR